jgi:hypothetical protein
VFVHGSQAAYRSASTRLSHSPIWFQLVKFRLTSSKTLIPTCLSPDPKSKSNRAYHALHPACSSYASAEIVSDPAH